MTFRVLKFIICFSIFLFFIFDSSSGVFANNTEECSFVIQTNDNLMTVKAKDIPLRKVLKEISKNMGVKVVSFVSGDELMVTNFFALPIEKGLKRLFRSYNIAIVRNSEKSKSKQHEIIKIIIISKMSKNQVSEVQPNIILHEEHSLESLSMVLNDDDLEVRMEAMNSLAAIKDARRIDLLTEILLKDTEYEIRSSAAAILGSIGVEASIDPLIYALQDENVEVKLSAIEALGRISGYRAIQALKAALSDDDEDVRDTATEILKQIKS